MRTIKTCPGIGDSIWLFMKLVNAGEQFNWQISASPPQRGKQIFDLMPQVAASCEYKPGLGYSEIKARNIMNICRLWRTIRSQDFYLSINAHLESGRRIEEFLPDLPTTYLLEYATTEYDDDKAESLLHSVFQGVRLRRAIGIYGSAYSTQRAWGLWDEKEWMRLIYQMYKTDSDLIFVIIGASFDVDLGGNLIKLLDEQGIPYINTIGEPLSVVIEILKRLNYFIGFPSGLSILNETLGKDGFMFYPSPSVAAKVCNIMNTWAHPSRIASGAYKAALPCDPIDVYNWLKNDYKLFDRL